MRIGKKGTQAMAGFIFFVLFGTLGLNSALRGNRNVEQWLVGPPVTLCVAMGVWSFLSRDPALGFILSSLLVVFSTSAAGALTGLAVGRYLYARRTVS